MRGGKRGEHWQSQGRGRGRERRGLECRGFALLRGPVLFLSGKEMTRRKILESRNLWTQREQPVQHELGSQPQR